MRNGLAAGFSFPEYRVPQRTHVYTVVMILVVLLATGLRLHELNTDSLWGDELFEARNAQNDVGTILGGQDFANRPILLLTHLFMLAGSQEFLVRFAYAAAGILGVAVVYRMGKTLFDTRTGIVASFLLAVSAFHIQYSQEARSYSLTVLLTLASLYCLLCALQDNRLGHWVGFATLTALSLNNNAIAFSVLGSEVAFGVAVSLWDRLSGSRERGRSTSSQDPRRMTGGSSLLARVRSSRELMLLFSTAGGLLLFLLTSDFWLSYLVSKVQVGVGSSGDGGGGSVVRLSLAYFGDLLGAYGVGDGWRLYLVAAVFGIGLVTSALCQQWKQLLLVVLWVVPPFLVIPFVSSSTYFGPRHLIFMLPIYLIFVARGISAIAHFVGGLIGQLTKAKSFPWEPVTLVLLAGIFGWMSMRPVQVYYAKEKQDWKSAVAFLYERIGAEDIIIQMLVWPQEALGYYWKRYYPDEPMEFYNPFQVDEDDFPADVWWVFSLSSGNSPPRKHNKLQRLLGDAFEVSRFYQVAIVHREMEIQDLVDYSGVADQLISAQAEVDNAARRDLYSGRLVRLWQGLAETWADAGRYEQAIVAYERAIELAPFREGFFVRLAQVYHAIGQPDMALVNLQQAVDVAPDQAWPRLVLADTYRSLGQLDLAIATYQEVLQLAPESAEAHLGLGLAYEAQGMTEGAIHEYHIVVEMAPESGPGQRAQQKLDAYDQ